MVCISEPFQNRFGQTGYLRKKIEREKRREKGLVVPDGYSREMYKRHTMNCCKKRAQGTSDQGRNRKELVRSEEQKRKRGGNPGQTGSYVSPGVKSTREGDLEEQRGKKADDMTTRGEEGTL